ncbi:hypothetical protein [Saccharothrix sp. ST-888]|uniref:hypothetical protein n=1 Tax=Saccharothrix sp. ST-888 TaxID=1427391 RepID=UPI0005EC63A2|nr:hypothetical protein [Saccharothrix sp. ST-888]KJK58196.1 hypothetical protein UK12_11860 [Saccharothrix sp. ST-888]
MAFPEGWEWLDELPTWEPPKELRGPASSTALNLAIKMLSCDILGNDVCALVGRFVTEHSLFNVWFLRDAKGSGRDARQLAQLSSIGREQTRLVFESWERFLAATSVEGPNEHVRELIRLRSGELSESLRNASVALTKARDGSA